MNSHTIVEKGQRILSKEIDGEMVLLNLINGDYIALNSCGMEVWKLIDGKSQVAEVASALSNKYGISKKLATKHVIAFFADLQSKDFIRCHDR